MPRARTKPKPKTAPSDLRVTVLPLADLTPYLKNPRHITPAAGERRYCQRKGCRGWWVHKPRQWPGGRPRRYCEECNTTQTWLKELASPGLAQRHIVKRRESFDGLEDDRIGFRVDRSRNPRVPCERCLDRPARKGFSFCMQCSVCARCGRNKPEIGRRRCRSCRLALNEYKRAKRKTSWRKRKNGYLSENGQQSRLGSES